jgi:hypothetical protein
MLQKANRGFWWEKPQNMKTKSGGEFKSRQNENFFAQTTILFQQSFFFWLQTLQIF